MVIYMHNDDMNDVKKVEVDHKGWTSGQVSEWFSAMMNTGRKRNYDEVKARLQALPANTHTLETYGDLSVDLDRYPLMCVSVGDFENGKPNILITGGVHGYEPSGIEAALRFLETEAMPLSEKFNFKVYPCLSPWAFEYDHRWNNQAEDPNRLFSKDLNFLAGINGQPGRVARIDECQNFMDSMEQSGISFAGAIDLHETPDRDVFLRQERADRFGTPLGDDYQIIPQGFYLILTTPGQEQDIWDELKFGRHIISGVKGVSPIAPEEIVLNKKNQGGIIFSPPSEGTLRSYLSNHAGNVAVTEVYPDHPEMNPDTAVATQIAAVHALLDYLAP
ncbi:MAG: succinylglutamate desuccinylase/aspartoacylase family protein [Rhodospirillales bacterium]|nr:succinylglutamate desuccinylase/aspartoacylase family protein [Rhodospirillales bacterium]